MGPIGKRFFMWPNLPWSLKLCRRVEKYVERPEVLGVADKGEGKGAIALVSRKIFDDGTDEHLATVDMTLLMRGDGGCGSFGEEMLATSHEPEGECHDIVSSPTRTDQALIYRLSGDTNPLHVDPEVSRAAGFDRPILHGLCAYGVVGHALLESVLMSDETRFRRMDVRFSAPIYPGETIETEIWREAAGKVSFRCRAKERDVMVLKNGVLEYA